VLDRRDEPPALNDAFFAAYLAGDETKLDEIGRAQFRLGAANDADFERIIDGLLVSCNRAWIPQLDQLHAAGGRSWGSARCTSPARTTCSTCSARVASRSRDPRRPERPHSRMRLRVCLSRVVLIAAASSDETERPARTRSARARTPAVEVPRRDP